MPKPDFETQSMLMLGIAMGGSMDEAVNTVCEMEISKLANGTRMNISRSMHETDRQALMNLGFYFPKEFEDGQPDPMLMPVVAPRGWKISRTDHSMWSELRDPRDRVRGMVGYKGAFYDRWANFYLHTRFVHSHEYASSMEPPLPEIAALTVTKTVEYVVREEVTAPHLYDRMLREMYDEEYFTSEWSSGIPPVYGRKIYRDRVVKEEVVEKTYDPHRNQEHAQLPYVRYFVKDRVTDQRVWVGPWLSSEVARQIDSKNGDLLFAEGLGLNWLHNTYPDYRSVLAYWD